MAAAQRSRTMPGSSAPSSPQSGFVVQLCDRTDARQQLEREGVQAAAELRRHRRNGSRREAPSVVLRTQGTAPGTCKFVITSPTRLKAKPSAATRPRVCSRLRPRGDEKPHEAAGRSPGSGGSPVHPQAYRRVNAGTSGLVWNPLSPSSPCRGRKVGTCGARAAAGRQHRLVTGGGAAPGTPPSALPLLVQPGHGCWARAATPGRARPGVQGLPPPLACQRAGRGWAPGLLPLPPCLLWGGKEYKGAGFAHSAAFVVPRGMQRGKHAVPGCTSKGRKKDMCNVMTTPQLDARHAAGGLWLQWAAAGLCFPPRQACAHGGNTAIKSFAVLSFKNGRNLSLVADKLLHLNTKRLRPAPPACACTKSGRSRASKLEDRAESKSSGISADDATANLTSAPQLYALILRHCML